MMSNINNWMSTFLLLKEAGPACRRQGLKKIILKHGISKSFVVMVCLLFLFSCERSVDFEIPTDENSILVVEAILTNENKTQQIKLSLSSLEFTEAEQPVTNADVKVTANNVEYEFQSDLTRPGYFISASEFSILNNLDYELSIIYLNERYLASSQLSNVSPIPAIDFSLFGMDSFQLGQNIVPLFSGNQQSMYRFDLDWSHIYGQGQNKARMYYYTFNTVHINEFIRPEAEVVPFPRGTIVTVTKYGLDDGFADYLRSLAIETDWNGAILYANPENLPSNISEGGIGYFATCAVLRDTIVVE